MSNYAEEVIEKLKKFSSSFSLDCLFVVGEYCRNSLLNKTNTKTISVICNDHNKTLRLCGLFASEVLNTSPAFYHEKGIIPYQNTKIVFQDYSLNSYMGNEEVLIWLKSRNIENKPLFNNVYGRSFTLDTVVLSLHNGEYYDLTKRAAKDIENKELSTVLPSWLAVKYRPIIVLEALQLACLLGFKINPNLRKRIKESGKILKKYYSKDKIEQEILKLLRIDIKEALKELQKYDLVKVVMTNNISRYIKKCLK